MCSSELRKRRRRTAGRAAQGDLSRTYIYIYIYLFIYTHTYLYKCPRVSVPPVSVCSSPCVCPTEPRTTQLHHRPGGAGAHPIGPQAGRRRTTGRAAREQLGGRQHCVVQAQAQTHRGTDTQGTQTHREGTDTQADRPAGPQAGRRRTKGWATRDCWVRNSTVYAGRAAQGDLSRTYLF